MASDDPDTTKSELTEAARRLAVLRPYLDGEAPLTKVAADAGIRLRTARRWVARVRAGGPVALQRTLRSDAGKRRLVDEIVALVEGLAVTTPRLLIATIHRRVSAVARERGWVPPSYASVHAIVSGLDPAMLLLAHEGGAAFRDRYELVHRHREERPNATWQADHSQLDMVILDANGAAARPWLTTVIDDYSRAVAGYMVFLARRPRSTRRWRCGRRSGASRTRTGRFAASLTCCMSITEPTSPVFISIRRPPICASD